MKTLRLLLGDQLNINHSWFNDNDPNNLYVMMEVKDETSYVKHHVQKILGIFAAMRNFDAELKQRNFSTLYLTISDPQNKHSFIENLRSLFH